MARNDCESRILEALGLSRGPLPKVGPPWLRRYYEWLVATLEFPFSAKYVGDVVPGWRTLPSITVVRLVHPGDCRSGGGLFCVVDDATAAAEVRLVDVEVEESDPRFQILDDYWYWFWNWRFDPRI